MPLTEARLLQYLRQRTGIETLDSNTVLFSDGTVDSVGMVDLIAFLEEESGCEIRQDDVTLENFDNASKILALVAERAAD